MTATVELGLSEQDLVTLWAQDMLPEDCNEEELDDASSEHVPIGREVFMKRPATRVTDQPHCSLRLKQVERHYGIMDG